jgi:hypothetical protein
MAYKVSSPLIGLPRPLTSDLPRSCDGALLTRSEKAKQKSYDLLKANDDLSPIMFSEFGTRRRRSYHVQDLVMKGLLEGHQQAKKEAEGSGKPCGALSGSSNVSIHLLETTAVSLPGAFM